MDITSLESLENFAIILAKKLKPGDIVLIEGDYGVGKTTLCQKIIKILTNQQALSPSFQMIKKYNNIVHCDFYMLEDYEQLLEKGLDHFNDKEIYLIEWPKLIKPLLQNYYLVSMTMEDNFRYAILQHIKTY